MIKSICLAASLFALACASTFGQPTPPAAPLPAPRPPGDFQQRLQAIVQRANPEQNQPPALTKFNLDFPGGTPAQLVKAIEKAMGKPLNAIIPTEDAEVQLPPLKMNDVVTPQLFYALEAASRKVVAVSSGSSGFGSYQQVAIDYGFKTADSPVTDASIWYFHAEKPSLPPVVSTEKICRFYPLLEYLNRGFTVDDITTAIQTGWKMSGETSPPELNYHKETKLLIAFGEPGKLQTIRNVLDALPAESAIHTRSDLNGLHNQIRDMQATIDQLQAKMNQLIQVNSHSTASPEEKSGK